MSQDPRTDDPLPLSQALRLNPLCNRFEAAWQAASGQRAKMPGAEGGVRAEGSEDTPGPPRIEEFLNLAPDADRPALLRELMLLDIHYRQACGERCQTAEYRDSAVRGTTEDDQPVIERAGTVIGPYKLLEQIGEGGFGIVFMAEQQHPVRRKVALKVIKPGMDSAQVIARFEAERQALALMDHLNIARVFDAGATATGRPYFVMELVHGVPITRYCDDNRLTPRERLELFIPVCQAIQHAHQKGIIHRDIKPSNVMVCLYDGKPVPKVIDFGVAKAIEQRLTERTLFTQYGTIVGTFEYMAPEQAEMSQLGVDTRSDLYALGVLLYELLTGSTPLEHKRLQEADYYEILRMIKEEEPPRPSRRLSSSGAALATISQQRRTEPAKLTKLVRGELDWIVMKCLEKDRTRRYETASSLARDLRHYLADEPVEACPPSAAYRLRKFARKYRMPVAVAAAFAVMLLAGVLVSTWQAVRATRAEEDAVLQRDLATDAEAEATKKRQEAEAAHEQARQHLYAARINLMLQAWDANQVGRLQALLAETEDYPDRGFEWYYWQRQCHLELHTLIGHSAEVRAVSWSPDGKLLATGSFDGTVKVWQAAGGQELLTLKGDRRAMVDSVSWSPDGKRLASGGTDGMVKVWDAADRRKLFEFNAHTNLVSSVSWSPDGKRLATGSSDRTAKVWDAANGWELLTLTHAEWLQSVSWSPDGKRLATGGGHGMAKVWDAADGRALYSLEGHTDEIKSVSWSPDGNRLATGCGDGTAKVWDAADGRELFGLNGHAKAVRSVSWSPDGKRLATGSWDGTAKVWDAAHGRELFPLKGHTGMVQSVSWSPDGKRLATGSWDGTAKVWDVTGDPGLVTLQRDTEMVSFISWSPDGKQLATGRGDGTVMVWDVRGGRELLTLKGHRDRVDSVSWSSDGKQLATGSFDGTVKVWELTGHRYALSLQGRLVSWSPDGTRLATVSEDGTAKVLDARDGRPLPPLHGHRGAVTAISWSPDSKRLATASADGTAIVWEAARAQKLAPLQGHTSAISVVTWSPDGKRVASACTGYGLKVQTDVVEVKIWDAADGREMLTLKGHTGKVHSVSWSPDGKRLATGSEDGTVIVWDASGGRELLAYAGKVTAVSWSPDGQRLAIGSSDGTAKLWEAASIEAVKEWARQDRALNDILARKALRDPHAQGFIRTWLLLLPLPLAKDETGAQALDRQQLAGEAHLRPRIGERIQVDGPELVWREHRSPEAVVDFNAVVGRMTERSVAYAVCYLENDRPRDDLWLQVGSDDQAKVYLNGREIYESRLIRHLNWLDTVGPVALKQGTNVLVFKVVNEPWQWEGCVQLVDKAGRPAQGIRVKLTPE